MLFGINISQILGTYIFNKGAEFTFKNIRSNPIPIFKRWNKELIRVSISYLFKIRVKDENNLSKYLLVRNSRVPMFQPVGGVYKYYESKVLEKLEARDDKFFHKKKDLRIRIPMKNVGSLIRRFNNDKTWREPGYGREFKEELLETRILPKKLFSDPTFRFITQKNTGLRKSVAFQCNEVNFYDIVEVILTPEQSEHLQKLAKTQSKKFIFATENAIMRQGFEPLYNSDPIKISEHSKQII